MKIKKIITILLVAIILLNMFQIKVQAIDVNFANIENLGECERHLQYWKSEIGKWSYIITQMVGYKIGDKTHYAYCLESDKKGVGAVPSYGVNVSKLLEDDRIWRCIINGFPYKSPSQIGVANEQDAFVATKQAVYSVIYDRDVDTYYRGADERGIQIVNAIKNMVKEARTGTYTSNTTDLLDALPVGELKKENEEYYSQEYKISSSVEINDYNITEIIGFPEGSYIYVVGENFKILIPKNKILDNINGTIKIEASAKTYPVFLGESPDSNWQNYALTYDAYTNVTGKVELEIDAYKSKLKILKIDEETEEPIQNVKFNIKYEDGTEIGNFITDEQGIINISGLKQGKVIITETKTGEEYILNTEPISIIIDYDQEYEIKISNEKIKIEEPNEPVIIEVEEPEIPKLPVTGK